MTRRATREGCASPERCPLTRALVCYERRGPRASADHSADELRLVRHSLRPEHRHDLHRGIVEHLATLPDGRLP